MVTGDARPAVTDMAEALSEAWNIEHASGPRDCTTPDDWRDEAYLVMEGLEARGWTITPPEYGRGDEA